MELRQNRRAARLPYCLPCKEKKLRPRLPRFCWEPGPVCFSGGEGGEGKLSGGSGAGGAEAGGAEGLAVKEPGPLCRKAAGRRAPEPPGERPPGRSVRGRRAPGGRETRLVRPPAGNGKAVRGPGRASGWRAAESVRRGACLAEAAGRRARQNPAGTTREITGGKRPPRPRRTTRSRPGGSAGAKLPREPPAGAAKPSGSFLAEPSF